MLWWFFRISPMRFMLAILAMTCFMIAITGNGDIFMNGIMAYLKQFQPKSVRQQQEQRKQAQTRLVSHDGQPIVIDQQTNQQASQLQITVIELQKQLEESQQINDELIQELQRNCAVVLMTQDSATFQDGVTVHVGDQVKYGHYAGAKVNEIDYKQRVVVLDTGDVLRMGGGVFESGESGSGGPGNGNVSRSVQTTASKPKASRGG